MGARSTVAANYQRMRTEAFTRMQAINENGSDSEEGDTEEDLSDNFDSSDEDIELIDYENAITKDLWVPNDPKLYVIYDGRRFVNYNDEQDLMNQDPLTESSDEEVKGDGSDPEDNEEVFHIENQRAHSEYMTIKQLNSFSQASLRSSSVYMLDFHSEVIVWVGSKVSAAQYVQCFKYVGQCARAVSSKGKRRRERITFSMTMQGFEPEVFKNAFPIWEPFPRPGIDDSDAINEEDEDSDSQSSQGSQEERKDGGSSTAAATNVDSAHLVELSADQKKKVAANISESFWINF